jgi:fucose permease
MSTNNLSTKRSTGTSLHAAEAANTGFVVAAAVFAALGGLLFGYDTGVISGAVIFITKQFGLSAFPEELVVSMVLVGAAVGALSGGRLADRFGRRRMLLVTSLIFIVGAIACALCTSLEMLLVGRVIVGLGIGLSSTTVPVYISEVSPARARGWQVSLFQLAITVGILAAYLVVRERGLALDARSRSDPGSHPRNWNAVHAGDPSLAHSARAVDRCAHRAHANSWNLQRVF